MHRPSTRRLSEVRWTVALLLIPAFLLAFVSVWRFHVRYLTSVDGGIGASLAGGGWLPDVFHSGRNSSRSNEQRQDRVYCMVPFIWTPSAFGTYRDIRSSWGKRCHVLRFFVDPVIGNETGYHNLTDKAGIVTAKEANLTPLPDDVVVLHDMRRPWHRCVTEFMEEKRKSNFGNCRNIFEKVWRMIVHVAHGSDGAERAEWFVKVDADTFLFPDNLARYVRARKWTHNEQHYFGHALLHRVKDRGVPIVAGGAVFFSRATLLAASDAFQRMPIDKGDKEEDGTCRDAYTGTEEVVTAVCLKEFANVTGEAAIDEQGREGVSLYEVWDVLTWNRTDHGEWWYWQGKKRYKCHDDGDCLMHLPLAWHRYKDSRWFLDIEKELYGNLSRGEADDSLVKSKDGKLAARFWPKFDISTRYFQKIREAMRAGRE